MRLSSTVNDKLILEEMGRRLMRRRLEFDLTQAQLAEQAGVGKRTVERVEAGQSTQLLTLIRLLRVLGLLEGLESLLPLSVVGPMALLEEQKKQATTASRQRASSQKGAVTEQPWSWGDES